MWRYEQSVDTQPKNPLGACPKERQERDTKEVTGMTNKNECHSCKWFCQYEPVCMHESLDHELYSESDYCCSDYEEDDRE